MMANEQANGLLQQGVAAYRAGQQAQARQLFQEALRLDPRNEAAWMWMSSVAQNDNERAFCFRQILSINPRNETASKGLQTLSATPTVRPLNRTSIAASSLPSAPAISSPRTPPASQTSLQTGSRTSSQSAAPGVPVPDERRLSASINQLDDLLQTYRPVPSATLPIQWTRKRTGRIGDSSATLLRAGIIGGLLLSLIIVGGGLYAITQLRGSPVVAFFTTPTNTPTTTNTPTPTSGFTNTPSITPRIPYTPTSTLVPPATPGSVTDRINTPFYPLGDSGPMRTAQAFYAIGRYATAIPTFESERKSLEISKGSQYDAALYMEVLAQIDAGLPKDADKLLADNKSDTAFYHAAAAYSALRKENYDGAIKEGIAAYTADKRLVSAALTAAEAYIATRQYGAAYDLMGQALRENPANVMLLVMRGEASLGRDDPDGAIGDAGQALVIDPLAESAYILRSRALLARAAKQTNNDARIQAYGTAVLAAQDYLFYYPGATRAWTLYGLARQGEGDSDAAVNAFTQALAADQTSDAAVEAYLARGSLYLSQNRNQEAFDDFDKVVTLPNSPLSAHQLRLTAALALQNYVAAQDDLNALSRANPSDTSLIVQRIDLQVRQGKYENVLGQFDDKFVEALSGEVRATALLDRAIVRYENGKYEDALKDVNASLSLRESGTGHYYRARILEQQKQYQAALIEYQWVAYWGDVYGYPFAPTVSAKINEVSTLLPTDTPTPTPRPPTNTPTNTPLATDTPTPTSTRTLIPSRTPSSTPQPSNTPTASLTLAPSSTFTPSNTPTPSRTPLPSRTPFPSRTPIPSKTPSSS